MFGSRESRARSCDRGKRCVTQRSAWLDTTEAFAMGIQAHLPGPVAESWPWSSHISARRLQDGTAAHLPHCLPCGHSHTALPAPLPSSQSTRLISASRAVHNKPYLPLLASSFFTSFLTASG